MMSIWYKPDEVIVNWNPNGRKRTLILMGCYLSLSLGQNIMRYPPTKQLTSEEQDLIWKFRFYLSNQKKVTTELIARFFGFFLHVISYVNYENFEFFGLVKDG